MSTTPTLIGRAARALAATALAAITAGVSVGTVEAGARSTSGSPFSGFEMSSERTVADVDVIGTLDPEDGASDGLFQAGPHTGNLAEAQPSRSTPLQGVDDIKAAPGCAIACITSGVAYQHGPDARLKVTTDTPARIWILVWNDTDYYAIESSTATDVTEFEAIFDGVDTGSTYYASAIAEDADGYSHHADGEFTTGERHVEIAFGSADVTTAPDGATEMSTYTFVEDEGSSSGGLPSTTTRHDVERHLDLTAFGEVGIPNDEELCEVTQFTPDSWHYEAMNCSVYAGVYADDIDLDDRPANAASGAHVIDTTLVHPGGGALPPGYGQQLQFSVPVELTVWYG